MLVLAGLMTPGVARAHRICLYYDLDPVYRDASPAGDGFCPNPDACEEGITTCCDWGEDFGRRDGDPVTRWPARRHLVRVSAVFWVFWGWLPLDERGCTGDFFTEGESAVVEYLPWAHWQDRDVSIVGLNCESDQDDGRCGFDPALLLVELDPSGTTHVRVEDPDGGDPLLAVNSLTWAASAAEERLPLWSDIVTYMFTTNKGVGGMTVTNYWIGGQPTVQILHNAFRAKFAIAHEYGHTQTQFHAIAKLGEVFREEGLNYLFGASMEGHTAMSPEWQSAATVEGFANYYSLLAWWDSAAPVAIKLLVANTPGVVARNGDTTFQREIDDACLMLEPPQDTCPAGVANETDWMAALWNLSLAGVAPEDVMTLLSRAYVRPEGDTLWPVNEESDAFWINFTGAAEDFLEPQEYDTFLAIANQAGIDR